MQYSLDCAEVSLTHISIIVTLGRYLGKGWELVNNLDLKYLLFSSYTLGITVKVKSHWFPQLLPYYL